MGELINFVEIGEEYAICIIGFGGLTPLRIGQIVPAGLFPEIHRTALLKKSYIGHSLPWLWAAMVTFCAIIPHPREKQSERSLRLKAHDEVLPAADDRMRRTLLRYINLV